MLEKKTNQYSESHISQYMGSRHTLKQKNTTQSINQLFSSVPLKPKQHKTHKQNNLTPDPNFFFPTTFWVTKQNPEIRKSKMIVNNNKRNLPELKPQQHKQD
jgi:hypothetical protein